MTQSLLAKPTHLNGEPRSPVKKTRFQIATAPLAKRRQTFFHLAKSDPPTYLETPIMATKNCCADEKTSSAGKQDHGGS